MQARPKRLRSGSRVGIVNPAYWLETAKQQSAVRFLEDMGYELILGKSTELRANRFAGTPEQRAADLMTMFTDDSVDAIICGRGGYGANRVLPLLDYELLRANPKIFVGYSDVTGLLCSLSQRSNFVTFHGPMLSTFSQAFSETDGLENNSTRKGITDYNFRMLMKVLSAEDAVELYPPPESPAHTLNPGVAFGPLWGGNLCLVIERLATDGELNTDGCILFLEDIDEDIYSFERMMLHLKNSGCLNGIKGLVMGEMVDMKDGDVPFGKTTDEIVLDVCEGLNIPIVSNFPCGHGEYQVTLPVSHIVELHADETNPYILIPESPVL